MNDAMNRINDWYNTFGPNQRFAVWGCSDFAEQLVCNLKEDLHFAYMIDRDEKKEGTDFCGLKVHKPDYLNQDRDVKIIISNTYMGTRVKIANQLQSMGFEENKDYTYAELVLSIYNWKMHEKIVSQYVEISTTTLCTLNCKNCTAYMPYVTKKYHVPLQELQQGTDFYFESIDYVGRFRILGGEPMLYPDLNAYLEYVGSRYRSRIGELCIVTNGTIPIKPELLNLAVKYDVTFFVSNYSKSGHPLATEKHYEDFIKVLKENHLRYYFSDSQKWLSLGNPKEFSRDLKDVTLPEKFNDCRHYCRSIVGNRLFLCATWAFAVLGGVYTQSVEPFIGKEILDLKEFSQVNKEERFHKWFEYDIEMKLPNGYLDFCKYCNGFGSKNTCFVPVGEQKER